MTLMDALTSGPGVLAIVIGVVWIVARAARTRPPGVK